MKKILISVRPKWCEKIASGKKTIEVRKTAPKEVPFKAYIYCTNQKINGEILLTNDKKVEGRNRGFRDNGDIPLAGKVIGEFICDKIHKFDPNYSLGLQYCFNNNTDDFLKKSCLSAYDLLTYLSRDKGNKEYSVGYGWYITNLKIYDKPKELSEFSKVCPYYDDCENCKHKSENCKEWREIKRPLQSWGYIR